MCLAAAGGHSGSRVAGDIRARRRKGFHCIIVLNLYERTCLVWAAPRGTVRQEAEEVREEGGSSSIMDKKEDVPSVFSICSGFFFLNVLFSSWFLVYILFYLCIYFFPPIYSYIVWGKIDYI